VSELGDVLELIDGAVSRWLSVRLIRTSWRDPELSMEAMRRRATAERQRGANVGWFSLGGEEVPARTERTQRVWFDRRRDGERAEWTGATEQTFVRDGNKSWSWSPEHGTEFRDDAGSTSSPAWQRDVFLDPSLMLPAVDLEVMGHDLVFGREAITVRAVPRAHDIQHGMFARRVQGLDEIVIAVDAERGVLLRETGYLDRSVVYVEEVTEISFDEQFDDEVFLPRRPGKVAPNRGCSAFTPEERRRTSRDWGPSHHVVARAHRRRLDRCHGVGRHPYTCPGQPRARRLRGDPRQPQASRPPTTSDDGTVTPWPRRGIPQGSQAGRRAPTGHLAASWDPRRPKTSSRIGAMPSREHSGAREAHCADCRGSRCDHG
jgi:outer membrane lipoprotein-sorting protein